MNENHSTEPTRIRALKTSMVSLLEDERDEGIQLSKVIQGSRLLHEAFQTILNEGSKLLVDPAPSKFGATLQTVEASYMNWREVGAAFTETLRLAYNGDVSKENLILDSIYADLRDRVGEPIGSLYTRLHSKCRDHLGSAPWDAHMVEDVPHIDKDDLEGHLKDLLQGDHLDVEDAVEGLTGPVRHAFAQYLETRTDSFDMLEESLWMRPEILIANDYWHNHSQTRILDVLSRKGNSRFTRAFSNVQDFMTTGDSARPETPERIVERLRSVGPEQRETLLRCLMLHPDQGVRRYASANINTEGFWKIVTPRAVPCATILSMLEKVLGSAQYDEAFQRVFFHAIYRRLFSLTSRSEVLYTRGIIHILTRLPFLMEDDYFERLERLIDHVSTKEKFYQIKDGILDQYVDQFKREKDAVGSVESQTPSLTSVPPVVLRKLARDGHFWYDLATHPMFKIARETIPHINTAARALRIVNNQMVSPDVLRVIGKRRSFFHTLPSKIALLANPRTPLAVSLPYIVDLSTADIDRLLRTSTVHPELRSQLHNRLTV